MLGHLLTWVGLGTPCERALRFGVKSKFLSVCMFRSNALFLRPLLLYPRSLPVSIAFHFLVSFQSTRPPRKRERMLHNLTYVTNFLSSPPECDALTFSSSGKTFASVFLCAYKDGCRFGISSFISVFEAL